MASSAPCSVRVGPGMVAACVARGSADRPALLLHRPASSTLSTAAGRRREGRRATALASSACAADPRRRPRRRRRPAARAAHQRAGGRPRRLRRAGRLRVPHGSHGSAWCPIPTPTLPRWIHGPCHRSRGCPGDTRRAHPGGAERVGRAGARPTARAGRPRPRQRSGRRPGRGGVGGDLLVPGPQRRPRGGCSRRGPHADPAVGAAAGVDLPGGHRGRRGRRVGVRVEGGGGRRRQGTPTRHRGPALRRTRGRRDPCRRWSQARGGSGQPQPRTGADRR